MAQETTDGYEITTVNQNGKYEGQETGRVWLRTPYLRGAQRWTWFGFGSVRKSREAAWLATTMTAAEFDNYWEHGTLPTQETQHHQRPADPAG